MLQVEISERVEAECWNAFIAQNAHADLMQTTHWAGIVADYHGHTPLYVQVTDGDQLVGALLMFIEPYLQMLTRPSYPRLHRIVKRCLPVLRWKRGPVLADNGRQAEILDAMLGGIHADVRCRGAVGILEATCLPDMTQTDCAAVLARTGTWHAHGTFLVDLTAGEEAIWGGMKKVARKAVRRANSQGIVVRRLTEAEDLGKVWRMLMEGWERLGTHYGRREDFLQVIWQALQPSGQCEFFLAEVDGEPVGSMGVWQFNGYVYEFFSGRAHAADEARLNVGDAIKWAIIQWGCAMGHRTYDLAGVMPVPENPKEAGIFSFKEKWGGTYTEYAVFSAAFRPRLRGAVDAVHNVLRRAERARLGRR